LIIAVQANNDAKTKAVRNIATSGRDTTVAWIEWKPTAEDPFGYLSQVDYLRSEAAQARTHLGYTYRNPLDASEKTTAQKELTDNVEWVGHRCYTLS
jgi:hypothetical protein